MPTTGIQRVYTSSSDNYMFTKLEDTRNNRYIAGATTEVGDCWVPWCTNTSDFLKKGIVVVNQSKGTVAGYIWQQTDKEGDDRVRYSRTGWEEPSTANRIPGFSGVGTKINLKIDGTGSISAEEASPKALD